MPPSSEMAKFRDGLGKKYGDRLVRQSIQYEMIPTGSVTLDYAMGTGGYVRGRTHELVGPPGVCKTTMSILAAVQHQKHVPGKAIGWIDMEYSFDYDWAHRLGLDTDPERFVHLQPVGSEDVSDMVKLYCQSGLMSLVVVDSIGGMESRKAEEKNAEDSLMGKNAQIITRMVKLTSALAWNNKVTVIFVNQLRANMAFQGQDISAGPKALQHNTTFKIQMGRATGSLGKGTSELYVKERINGDEIEVGRKYVAKVSRSRVSPSGKVAEFFFFNVPTPTYGFGIDQADEAMNVGIRTDVIKQAGAWYTLPSGKKANGRPALLDVLRKHPDEVGKVRAQAMTKLRPVIEDEELAEVSS